MRKYLIVVPFLLTVFLTHPFGNVLYGGDDWAYAWPIGSFLTSGKLILSTFVQAPAIPQILYATLITYIFGFSFRILNLSIIAIGLIGVIISYRLMKKLGIKDKSAALGAIFMSITPLYIGFTASFMSEMPYVVLMLAACLEYIHGLNLRRIEHILFASILSAVAFLSRQIGFFICIAFLIATLLLIYQKKLQLREGVHVALFGSVIPIVVFIAYFMFPNFFGGSNVTQHSDFYQTIAKSLFSPSRKIANFYRFWNYVIILLFPLYCILFLEKRKQILELVNSKYKTMFFFAFFYLLFALMFIITNKPLFIAGDFLHMGFICKELMSTRGQELLWNCLVLLSSIPASILFCLILQYLKTIDIKKMLYSSNYPGWAFIAMAIFIQGAITVTHYLCFNNYFLPLLVLLVPFLMKLMDYFSTKFSFIPTFLMLITAITVSALAIEPLHSFADTSWKEADRLVKSGIDSRKIYTHPSWYAWNNYDFFIKKKEGFFSYIKNNSIYLISELPFEKLTSNFYNLKLLDTIYYRTLLGKRSLYVYSYANNT